MRWLMGAIIVVVGACSGGGGSSSSASSSSSAGGAMGSSSSSGGMTAHGSVGSACHVDTDCTELTEMHCYTHVTNPFSGETVADFPGGFCSRGCPNGDECGTTYACATLSQGGGMTSSMLAICVPTCTTTDGCRASEGYTCHTLFGSGYCAPP